MKNNVLYAILATIIIIAIFITIPDSKPTSIEINGAKVYVESVHSVTDHQRGLSERKSMDFNKGMLFVFDSPVLPAFWMKDMNFPIDIVWIDENLKVIGVEKNISPTTYPQTFRPTRSITYVLETNAGWVEAYDIKDGDLVLMQ